jgi:hypothetical protein
LTSFFGATAFCFWGVFFAAIRAFAPFF